MLGKHPRHNQWIFTGPHGTEVYRPKSGLTINNAHVLRKAAIAGFGVSYLPSFIVDSCIKDNSLVALLPNYSAKEDSIYALYPASRYLSAGVRIFIDKILQESNSGRAAGRSPEEKQEPGFSPKDFCGMSKLSSGAEPCRPPGAS